LRICDRCGRKIEDEEGASLVFPILFKTFLPGGMDLCNKCQKEFHKRFDPKFLALRKEIEEWVKTGKEEVKP
jgi:hypothetical protein